MGVSIIRGAISSGKSDMCLKQISEIHEKNPDSKCIMIVPDHYSYETERKFVDFFGGIGLNNIEVLTLRRMSINFLSAKQQNHLIHPRQASKPCFQFLFFFLCDFPGHCILRCNAVIFCVMLINQIQQVLHWRIILRFRFL